MATKKVFIIPAFVFFVVYYFALPVLVGYALVAGYLELAAVVVATGYSPSDPLAALRTRNTPLLSDVVERLRQAAGNPAVAGLVAHVGPEVFTPAQVEELGADTFVRVGTSGSMQPRSANREIQCIVAIADAPRRAARAL